MYLYKKTPEAKEVEHLRDNAYALSKGRQGEIAAKIGVERTYFCQFLSGMYEPKISFVIRLARVLHVSVDYLLSDNGHRGSRTVVHKRIVLPDLRKTRRKKGRKLPGGRPRESDDFVD